MSLAVARRRAPAGAGRRSAPGSPHNPSAPAQDRSAGIIVVLELHRAGWRIHPVTSKVTRSGSVRKVLVDRVHNGARPAHAGKSPAWSPLLEVTARRSGTLASRPSGPSTRMSQGTRTRGSIVTLSSLAPSTSRLARRLQASVDAACHHRRARGPGWSWRSDDVAGSGRLPSAPPW